MDFQQLLLGVMRSTLLAIFISYSFSSRADIYPFYLNNQNPFVQIFGLPKAEPAVIVNKGVYTSIATLDIVNNTVKGETENERLILDGESYRFNMAVRYGLFDDVVLGIDIPLVKHRQGRFDNFIRNWHDTFGLSNVEQKQFVPNQLNYFYQSSSNTITNIHEGESGIGDIRVSFASTDLSVMPWLTGPAIIRAFLKIPTGKASELLGSGAFDAAFDVTMQDVNTLRQYHSGLAGSMGVLVLGKSDYFADIQRSLVLFASSTIDWDYWKPLVFKAQLDVHTSFYKSGIEHLGGDSLQLTVGGAINVTKNMHFDIGVTENLVTDSTPDIGLNLSLWIGL